MDGHAFGYARGACRLETFHALDLNHANIAGRVWIETRIMTKGWYVYALSPGSIKNTFTGEPFEFISVYEDIHFSHGDNQFMVSLMDENSFELAFGKTNTAFDALFLIDEMYFLAAS